VNAATAIPLNDTRPQYEQIKDEVQAAINRVLERSYFILGPEGEAFEAEFAAYLGVKHAVGVSNGTDAIHIAMRALDLGPGDEVLLPPHTATFSALGVSMSGATPTFADCEPSTGNLDPWLVTKAITPRTRAIMPVHLYGQAADLELMLGAAAQHGIPLIEDAAQAHGATYHDRKVGTLGILGCFSFYPTKNLGAYGDGGAITTDDSELAQILRELRNGGQRERYNHVRLGVCNRLDELQAAILRVKLPHLDNWDRARRENASRYDRLFAGADLPVRPLALRDYGDSAMHLYVIRVDASMRDALIKHLNSREIMAMVHYPVPVHLQEAYRFLDLGEGSYPLAERLASEIVTLPMYPELTGEQARAVVEGVREFFA
ncbi:MAG: DegT/DnrJ/EryC1/StrS family aminotransferase, partial [Chloroflexia bacterium]